MASWRYVFFFFFQNLFQKQKNEIERRNELNIAFIRTSIAAIVAISSSYLTLVHTPT